MLLTVEGGPGCIVIIVSALISYWRELYPNIHFPHDSLLVQEVTLDDPHQQRLARLHWELEQRRSQTTLCDQLTQDQQKVQQEIKELETKLASLAPRINTILQVRRLENV